jgi:WD40 repeat protein
MVRILTESLITIDDSANRPSVISFHPEYPILASNSLDNSIVNLREINQDNSVNLVNTLRNRNRNRNRDVNIVDSNIAFHPSGNFMATGSSRNKKVILWHIQPNFSNVNIVQTLEEHTMAIDSIAFHSILPLMATGSADYTVRLYHLTFTENNIQATHINTLTIHDTNSMKSFSIPSIVFHPTKNILATSSILISYSRTPNLNEIKLWEISSDNSFESCNVECRISLKNSYKINSIAFNSTGNLLASGDTDSMIKLWHITDNIRMTKCVKTFRTQTHSLGIYSVAFHPTHNILATGDFDANTMLWRISSNELFENWEVRCIIILKGHDEDCITSISFHKLYPFLATCSEDKIKIWKLNEEGEVEGNGEVQNNNWNMNGIRRPGARLRLQPLRNLNNSSNSNSSNNNSNNNNNNNNNNSNSSNMTFDGNNLVENCVYNIYKNEGNVNVGVCLVISENNRNNGTRIKLRKLIGSNELSLTKSEIYGKIPVNLRNTNLSDAVLTDADLTGADLTDANLIGAFLIGAFLIGADLHHAYLTDADLTGAFLIDSDLTNAELTYADLTDANLTGATLTGANLNNAIIFRDSLSALQKQQIIGQPNYIERVRRIQLQRPFGPEERIKIPENLINPVKKSNNSCPNFNGLYEFIMRQNLSGMFFFIYEGPNRKVIDFGGATRDVFDKILPAYTKKFFKEIEDNEDYVILKESVDMDTLIRETEQLILLARASETKIFLKIDPILLSLLVETKVFKTYFTNNKINRFTKLYAEFNQYIEENSNNNDRLLKHPNNKRELMKTLKNQTLKNEKLKIELEQEIRFRIFAIKCGFTNIKQFINMSNFITVFYNIPNRFITCKLKFDRETFVKRIKLFKKIKKDNFDNYTEEPIPLEQYVRLSQNNQSILILNRANDIIMNYPYLIPFLNFIFGPESSDDDRKLFVLYVSGSSSYTGELNIYLSYITHVKAGNIPYKSTTCEKYLELFKNKTQNRHPITVELIRQQLFSDTGFGRA